MKNILSILLFTVAGLAFSQVLPAQNELIPFVISFDAPDNITNVSKRLDAPAGKNGFVRAENGHFVTDKGRIQFWGTNTCFAANFPEKAEADRVADRLARFGINCVRLHHMDMADIWGGYDAKTLMTLDKGAMDKLDYFVAALKKRGIYVNLNLHVSRWLDERDGFPKKEGRTGSDKGIDNYYRPIIDANKKYAKDLLEHVNPYTGNAYKNEPTVAMIEINNENSVVCTWAAWGGLHQIRDPFLAELRKQWNDWLRKKYGNDGELKKHWNCRSVPLGGEMLRNGDFPKGYTPNWDGWAWETNDQTRSTVTNPEGVLRIDLEKKSEVVWLPQLTTSGFKVEKDRIYTLEIRMRANRNASVNVGLGMNHDPWQPLGFGDELPLTTQWKTYRFTVIPSSDDDNTRISLGSFQDGTVYEIDSISFKPGGEVTLPKEERVRDELLKNGDFPKGYTPNWDGWLWQAEDGAEAPLSNTEGFLRLDVRKRGGVEWMPQLIGSDFAVEQGKDYTLTFRARASRDSGVNVGVSMNHDPWQDLGFHAWEALGPEWRTVKLTFRVSDDDDNARVGFSGFEEGVVYDFDSVSLKPGLDDEPVRDGSLQTGTIPVIWKKDASRYPKEAVDDFCLFLLDVEAKYWDEMYRYLKEEIKVRQPVSGTQLEYGGIHPQARMDYCDIHAYWNHPVFPRRDWDMNDWYVQNRALVNHLDREILPSLATKRVHGKPFTMSEYNHPFPNQFAAEGFPIIAAFGAFQNWDGIFPFAYAHSKDLEPRKAGSFFDTGGNTVQMAHMIACHALFCDHFNAAADRSAIVAPLTEAKERDIFVQDKNQYGIGFSGLGLDMRNALLHPTALDLTGKVREMPKPDPIPESRKVFRSEGDGPVRLYFNMEREGQGYALVKSDSVGVFTGFVEEGKSYPLLDGTIRFGKTNLGWATASLTRIDSGPKESRWLLVVTGETTNTDMKIQSLGGDRVTVGSDWGREPILCEAVPAELSLKGNISCWALDESGKRKEEIKTAGNDGTSLLILQPTSKSIWYEIRRDR